MNLPELSKRTIKTENSLYIKKNTVNKYQTPVNMHTEVLRRNYTYILNLQKNKMD